MKNSSTPKIIFFLLALTLPILTHAQQPIVLTANDAAGTTSFNTAGHWSNAQAPSGVNEYNTTNLLRTPGDGNSYTFQGHSLTMGIPASYANGTLIFKGTGTGTMTINNLTNAGGLIRSGATPTSTTMIIAGNMFYQAVDSTILADQSELIIDSPLVGGDGIVLTNNAGNSQTITYNGTNSAFTGEFFLTGTATVVLGNVNCVPGNPTIPNPGQITLSAGASLNDTSGVVLTNSNGGITLLGSATINNTLTTVIAVPIAIFTNQSTLTKSGAGILVLSNAFNSYSNTTISAGTLQIGMANALPPHNVTDNGTLDLNGFSTTIDGIAGSGAVDTVSGGTPTLTIGVTGGLGTLTGVIRNSAGTLSLTKVGAGTETLAGGYTYSGSTLVAGGTLILTTAAGLPSTAGSLAVSNGAVLTVNATNGTPLPANSVTFGTNTTLNLNLTGAASGINAAGGQTFQDNAAINLNYGTISANPTVAAINSAGGISAPGSNTVINITAIGVKTGQFPLIKYTGASLGSIANFSLGSLPPGVAATLVNNTGNDSIDLNISETPRQITWSGLNGNSWDTTTVNWTNSDGTATAYRQITNGAVIAGDSVTFNDTLSPSSPQPTNVNLTAGFYPFPVVVNSVRPYSLGGAGGLAGTSGNTGIPYISQNNSSGTLTLLTSNSFTGGVAINAGTVVITNDFSLGANSSVVILNGGILQVNGNTTNSARTFGVPTASSIGVLTNVTAQFGGAVTGAGGLTKTDNGTLVLAGSNGITGTLTVNQGTLTTLGTNVLAAVPIIGNAVGFNGALNISGGAFQANNNGGSASSSSLIIGGVSGAAGDVVMSSGTLTVNRQLAIGAVDYGAFDQSGGTTTIGGFIACGATFDGGIFNQTGGTVGMNGSSATIGYSVVSSYGVMNLSGNAVFNMIGAGNGVWPGEVGNGTLNVSGNAALTITNDGVALGRNTGTGTVNLNGGTITVNFITNGPVAGTFNFNGGTLKANVASTSFTKGTANQTAFYDYNGGATIDDGGNAITFSQPLLAPPASGVASIPVPPGTSSGYIDAPIVVLADANGIGSNVTAIATVSGGAVTGIIITCPGSGFDPVNSFLSITFYGGGPNAVAPNIDPNTATFAANSPGGLTKKGSGTLTMTGLNGFPGAVNANAGTLSLTTASTLTGSTTVTNGAAFVIRQIGSATGSISNLTLNGGAAVPGATLGLGISAANNATVPLLKCGKFTVNGTNSINLAGALNVGTISLVQYVGALGGSGTITNLILPQGDVGFISNSVASSTLYAIISSTGPGLVWSGTNSVAALTNLWDIGSTTNWLIGSTLTTYQQPIVPGDAVTFNDTGSGTVILNTNAGPSSLVISNNAKSYTLKGLGSISGSTGLQKLGTGTAFLNLTNNTYTGDTVVSNGTLQVGNPTAMSSAANLNVGPSGTLELNGFGQVAGATAASGSVAGLSGSGVIDNNSPQNVTLIVSSGSGGTWNGTIQDHGAGGVSLQKVGTNTLIIGGTNHLDDGSLTGYSSVDQGAMIITNGGVLKIPYAQFYVGSIAGSSGTNIVAGGMLVLSNNLLAVGRGAATANGTLIVNSGTVQKTGANNIVVGSTGATGTLIVNGGQVLNNGALWLGDGSTAVATLYLNGGLIQATSVIPNGSPTVTPIAYFNGGTLQATTNSTSFLQVSCNVMGGGLILDDNGYNLNITAVSLGAGVANDGGLSKKGTGTVYLDTGNGYVGTTTVMNGTLAGIGSVNGSVLVTPAGNLGAGDAAAVGTFTIAKNLTLQGNATMRISKTGGTRTQDNIVVSGNIFYGGTLTINNVTSDSTTLAIGDTFQLFSVTGTTNGNFASIAGIPGVGMAYSFNPTNGLLSVVASSGPGTFTYPTRITSFALSGANVVMTGTNGQAGGGYYLLQSTNVGLPLSQWKVVATNVLSANGNYTFIGTNVVAPGGKQQFYILSNTNSNH